jgi:hypothetical protein
MQMKNYSKPIMNKSDWGRSAKTDNLKTNCGAFTKQAVASKGNRLIYSRDEMLKLRNNNYEMPKGISLPPSVTMDFILPNASSLKSVPVVVSCFSNKYESEKRVTVGVLNWERGTKVSRKLVHHDNSYVPPKLRKTETDKADLLVFRKTIHGVLNKLTPENLESCISEIRKLDFETEQHLNLFAELVFTKAIQQESYCEIYAKLTLRFCQLKVNGSTFRSVLLSKCQKLFQTGLENQIAEVKKCWAEKIAAETNERMKVLLEESVEEQMNKEKDKFFGNIRFICELYLHIKLPLKLIFSLINHLLNQSTDCVSLEAACRMLTILGKTIESCDLKTLDMFFEKIETISVSKDFNAKSRFRCKDLIDMRKRKWQLRKIEMLKSVVPKTLSALKGNS